MLSPSQIAIRALCRVAAAIRVGELPSRPDCQFLVASLDEYLATAAHGTSLETAFDLTPGPGGTTWWAAERRDRRDAMLRGLHTYHFSAMPAPEAAREILVAWRRYGRVQMNIDLRRGESTAAARTLENDFFILARLGGLPQEKRVSEILNGDEQSEAAEVFETV